jgi:hypothetical protein
MISLETYRDNLKNTIDESTDLVRTVNMVMSQPGLPVNLSTTQRDSIIEWAFVRVHAVWEGFLESCFVVYMLGGKTMSGFAPIRYVFPNDEQHALGMILAGRDFFLWTAPEALRRQSVLCFQDGNPFWKILGEATTELQEVNTLRNYILHRSRVSEEKFKSLVRDKLLTVPLNVTPASFLLTARSGTAKRTYFAHYCNKLTIVSNKIVPS